MLLQYYKKLFIPLFAVSTSWSDMISYASLAWRFAKRVKYFDFDEVE
jgi:hypothetical protein